MARMTKDDWFVIARTVLKERGHEALTIEELVSRAGVTKGSFYHHFGGQPAFIDAFLAHVRDRAFADVVADVNETASPREQLGQLVRAIAVHSPRLERAVRVWALSSPAAAALVQAVDADRYAYVRGLFLAATDDPQQAEFLTRLNFAFYLGCLQIDPPITGEEYVAMAGALERLLPSEPEGES
jgi:AcrR family transcriptional regulator